MRPGLYLALGVASIAAATWLLEAEQLSPRAPSAAAEAEGIDALLAGRLALETSVLEVRAGLQPNFDPIQRAVLQLRAAGRVAERVKTHGKPYAGAAAELAHAAQAWSEEEPAVERFKSDLALLQLSSRYFPLAADALVRRAQTGASMGNGEPGAARGSNRAGGLAPARADVGATARSGASAIANGRAGIAAGGGALDVARPGPGGAASGGGIGHAADRGRSESTRSALASRLASIETLRTDLERYVEAPATDIARRLEAAMAALETLGPALDRDARADLDVLLGHTRAILDRRERVDRFARSLVRSPVRVHLEAARTRYERAALTRASRVAALRVLDALLAFAGMVAVGLFLSTIAGERHRTSSADHSASS